MTRTTVMTALLAIEIVTVLVLVILMLSRQPDYKRTYEENESLKARIAKLQKHTEDRVQHAEDLQKRVTQQQREIATYANLAKIDRGILIKQRDDCEAKLNEQATLQCGDLCARCFRAVLRADKIIKETKAILSERRAEQ